VLALAVVSLVASDLAAVRDRSVDKTKAALVRMELKKMQGTWLATPADPYQVTIQGNQYRVTFKGKGFLTAVLTIDPTKRPRWITMRHTAGPARGMTLRGIYELKGDTLRLYVPQAPARPTAFPPDGSGDTLHRQKSPGKPA
jgi:uncharacterized protein (TIGR03067 family)